MKTLFALSLAILAMAFARAQSDPSSMLKLNDRDALIALPAVPLGSFEAEDIFWSSDSKYCLLVTRARPRISSEQLKGAMAGVNPNIEIPKQKLVLFSNSSGNVTTVNIDLKDRVVAEAGFIGPSNRFFVIARELNMNSATLYLGSPAGGQAVESRTAPSVGVIPSTKADRFYWYEINDSSGERHTAEFFAIGQRIIKKSSQVGGPVSIGQWLDDGRFGQMVPGGKGAATAVDPVTGKVAPLTREELHKLVETPLPGSRADEVMAFDMPIPPIRVAALRMITDASKEQDGPGLVIGQSDGTVGLAPNLSCVIATANGSTYARTMVIGDATVFEKAKEAAERTKCLSNAKQVALSIILFASDNDDNLPSPSGWAEQVSPYLKNSELLSSFVWTYNGGSNLASIENPATTELGFVIGPGGRAVAFADGHVKWFPDPKK